MGLLDGFLGKDWQDPQSQAVMALAGGLLSGNFGQGAKDYGNILAGAKDTEMKRKMLDMQMQNMQSEIEQRKMAQGLAAQKQDTLSKLFGGGTSPGAFVPSADGMGPTMPPSMQQPSGIGALDINKIAQLKAQYGIDLMEPFKWANDPLQMQPGSVVKDRLTGKERVIPKIREGVAADSNGFYSPLPGYADAEASIEGKKAGAVERAKSAYDLVEVPNGDGTTSKMPRTQAVSLLSGGQQQPGFSSADMARIYADAAQRGVTPDIRYTPGAGTFGRTQSPAEQARAVDTAKAEVVQATDDKQKASKFGDFKSQLQIAKTLLNAGPTNSFIGSQADKVAGLVGYAPGGATIANELKTVGGWMMQNIPKAPGAQSDAELRDYKVAAGEVGDDTVPVARRLASLNTVEKLIGLWEDRVNKGVSAGVSAPQSGGATGDFSEKPKAKAPVPMKGMVQGGYKFKGGNPADPANWEKQ